MSSTNEQLRWIFNYETWVAVGTYANRLSSHLKGKRHMNKIQLFICHTSKGKLKVKKFHAHIYCIALHFYLNRHSSAAISRVWIEIEAFNFRYAFDENMWNEKRLFQHRNWGEIISRCTNHLNVSRGENFIFSYYEFTIQWKVFCLFIVRLQ